jgi:serine protease Do
MIHFKKLLRAAVLCAAVVLTLALTTPAFGQGGQFRDLPPSRANPQFLNAFRDATVEASKSTVRVLCDDKEAALGTVIGPDGWILTKYSLLSGKVSCKLKDGKTLEAKIIGIHEALDLAMLKVEATDLPAAKLTESKVAPVGSWLVSVGAGNDPVGIGVLSVATRNPLPAGIRGGQPISNSPNSVYLGISVTGDGTAVKIERVTRQSAAEKAGLKVDDKIVSIQGQAITDQESLAAVLGKMKPGDVAAIKLMREGKELELKATLERRGPQPGRRDQNLMGSELSERRTGFPTYFQTDTVLKPKDCGGPVCDLEGHVLGINIARAGRVESYTIPTEALTPVLADLMSGKLSPKLVALAALERKIADLKATLKKAEEDKTAAEKKFKEAQAALKKQEADTAAAEKKWKETKDALDKVEMELKDKK